MSVEREAETLSLRFLEDAASGASYVLWPTQCWRWEVGTLNPPSENHGPSGVQTGVILQTGMV